MKKGNVYLARKLTWVISVITLISIPFFWDTNVKLINGEPLEGIYLIMVIMFTFMYTFMLFVVLCAIIWLSISNRKAKITAKRYAYHYDRTIKAFEDKDYEKVIYIYRNRFKNDEDHKNQTEKFLFAYNVITQ